MMKMEATELDVGDILDAHRLRYMKRRKTIKAPKMLCGSFYIRKKNPLRPLGRLRTPPDLRSRRRRRRLGQEGDHARHLMRNSAAAVRLAAHPIDPMAVLRAAYSSTAAKGSSTACIATLDGDRLRVANVGDSGFWIFRDKRCAFISPTQQHGFNCPYQLGNSKGCDHPSAAAVTECIVERGDILVVGTDGLLDNVYPSEIEMLLDETLLLEPKDLAQRIAEIAFDNSEDEAFCSPFQLNVEAAGCGGFTGGKIDDITVIVALIY